MPLPSPTLLIELLVLGACTGFLAGLLGIGGGMLTLLLAAISSKKKGVCSDYEITLKGPKNNFFIRNSFGRCRGNCSVRSERVSAVMGGYLRHEDEETRRRMQVRRSICLRQIR